jgi:CBS-domain-containing membrane protein
MIAKDIMSTKSYILHEDDDIYQAAEFMKEAKIRNLPVTNKDNQLVGIVTLREIVDYLVRKSKGNITHALGKKEDEHILRNIMIREVMAFEASMPLKLLIEVMIDNKFGMIPIVDKQRKLLGVVSEHEIMKKLYEFVPFPKEMMVRKITEEDLSS